jgi:hypothetical protein
MSGLTESKFADESTADGNFADPSPGSASQGYAGVVPGRRSKLLYTRQLPQNPFDMLGW